MSNILNFYQPNNLWSNDYELSLFRQVQLQNLIESDSYCQNSTEGFFFHKEQSIFNIDKILVFNGQHNMLPPFQLPQIQPFSPPQAQNENEVFIFKKQSKRAKKIQNSPFHNYQKHLNNALKTLVIVSERENDDAEYKQAAKCIWDKYCSMEIKTKRVLHYVFNQRNQHFINEVQLKTYGLLEIYRHYGQDVINKAKQYLSKLAIDQIDDSNIEGYLKTRKIKKVEGLKSYILNFKKELERGYIKRRINFEQTP